jgi:uncharacterized protein (TIGR03067 family)
MNTMIVLVCVVGLLLGADAKDDAKSDQQKLQGKWTLASGIQNGNEIPKDQVKGELVFKGNKYSWTTGDGQGGSGTFTLDPSRKPKVLDSVPSDGPSKGETIKEIYDLDGDNFKICFSLPGSKRPTEFKAEGGSNRWLFTYKRAK